MFARKLGKICPALELLLVHGFDLIQDPVEPQRSTRLNVQAPGDLRNPAKAGVIEA